MSIIRAIKHRLGLSVTTANNFLLDASANNGTKPLAEERKQNKLAAGPISVADGYTLTIPAGSSLTII